jgi:hypothetical protein
MDRSSSMGRLCDFFLSKEWEATIADEPCHEEFHPPQRMDPKDLHFGMLDLCHELQTHSPGAASSNALAPPVESGELVN